MGRVATPALSSARAVVPSAPSSPAELLPDAHEAPPARDVVLRRRALAEAALAELEASESSEHSVGKVCLIAPGFFRCGQCNTPFPNLDGGRTHCIQCHRDEASFETLRRMG